FRSMHGRQGHDGRDRPRSCSKHDERSKRIPRGSIVVRRWRLADRMAAAKHVESHIGDYHPSDDSEHIQRDVEDTQNLEPDQRRATRNNKNARRAFGGRPPSLRGGKLRGKRQEIEPHTTGLMTARTVTMACTIWCRFTSELP